MPRQPVRHAGYQTATAVPASAGFLARLQARARASLRWLLFLWREGRLRPLQRPATRERNSRRHRIWVACQLGLSFVLAYLAAQVMVELASGMVPMPSWPHLPVVLAAATVPLMQRLSPLSDHFDEDEFCRCYAIVVRLVRGLTEHAGSADALPGFAESLAGGLPLAHAEIRLRKPGATTETEVVSSWGERGSRPLRIRLTYHGERMGDLTVSRRRHGRFSSEERVLLGELARELAVAAHVRRMASALRRSRQQLAEAQEEERRRIRRDLHDSVGPVLAAVTMRVDATRVMLGDRPAAAEAVLAQLQVETRSAVAKVREMIHELRPAMPIDWSLGRATKELAALLERASGGRLRIRTEIEPDMPRLRPLVEVAAYRIVSEAMTNVVKHAAARHCVVSLQVRQDVLLEVVDDGVGPSDPTDGGLGLAFMQERARELGGMCAVGVRWPFGTRVVARLPLD